MLLSYFDNKRNSLPVLFIHGTASDKEIWEKQYNLLSKSYYRVIGIDLRGHGKSNNPGGSCSINDHLNDLKETIDSLRIKKPLTLVGHSFGAVLAAKFAEKYPEKVSKLLLVSLPARVPEILQKYYRWFLGKPIEVIREKLNLILKLPLRRRYKVAIRTDLSIVRDIWRESLKWDFLKAVPKVKCPVYLSVGRFDYIALRSMVKKLHSELPNSQFKVFNWSSHACMEDQPREFNEWILAVLALPLIQQGIS